MPLIGALVLLIQFSFAFHALKSGRPYWWIFIIMGFPVLGCVIYYLVEVFPGSREERSAHKAARRIAQTLNPDAELKRRAEELEICGSVDNKTALAEECMHHGMYAEATKLYESCLQGAFADDPTLLYGLAKAAIEGADWTKAAAALARLNVSSPGFRAQEICLLAARLLDGRGETDQALAAFRKLIPTFIGLEARYRYGDLLLRLGQEAAATEVFDELLAHSKRFASSSEEERQWIQAAQRAITRS